MTQTPPPRPITRRRLTLLTAGAIVAPAVTVLAQEDAAGMLRDQAKARGRLPVLVGLDLPQAGAGGDQTEVISRLRAVLFADLGIGPTADGTLAAPGIANVKTFASIPFVALTVDPAALDRLLAHPLVASVAEDTAVPPT